MRPFRGGDQADRLSITSGARIEEFILLWEFEADDTVAHIHRLAGDCEQLCAAPLDVGEKHNGLGRTHTVVARHGEILRRPASVR